jgi:MFS-type transporter involved in bile tolerance (Atg22 family)
MFGAIVRLLVAVLLVAITVDYYRSQQYGMVALCVFVALVIMARRRLRNHPTGSSRQTHHQ